MINRFKTLFFKRVLRKDARLVLQRKQYLGFSEARTFILLFAVYSKNDIDLFNTLSRTLRSEDKNVHEVVFAPENFKLQFVSPAVNRLIISKKDLLWYGKPVKNLLDEVADIHADFVLDLTTFDCKTLISIAMHAKAKMKVGIHSDLKFLYYDLLIKSDTTSSSELTEHILHYIKVLNSPTDDK